VIERVCVIGAGTIGSLVAGHLAGACDVQVLTRRPEHADALNESGLRVSGKSERLATVRATADAAELEDFDVGVIAVKANDLDGTAARLAGRFRGAGIMTIQNGLGAEEVVHRHGEWPIISAVTFMSGIRHSDAHVQYELDTATWMGPWAATATPYALVEQMAALMIAAGLQAEPLPDLLPAQWSKLIFNSAVNGVAALTGLPHVELFAREDEVADLGHLVHGLIDEGNAVAAAAGVALYDDPWEMNRLAVARGETTHEGEYAHVPSMLEDVRARRATEVDFITGAIVREALRLGVPAPLNAAVYRLVKAKEVSWTLRMPDHERLEAESRHQTAGLDAPRR
jgi:2-dehydropantoate 2-reductase